MIHNIWPFYESIIFKNSIFRKSIFIRIIVSIRLFICLWLSLFSKACLKFNVCTCSHCFLMIFVRSRQPANIDWSVTRPLSLTFGTLSDSVLSQNADRDSPKRWKLAFGSQTVLPYRAWEGNSTNFIRSSLERGLCRNYSKRNR